jgi:hypothetical protein
LRLSGESLSDEAGSYFDSNRAGPGGALGLAFLLSIAETPSENLLSGWNGGRFAIHSAQTPDRPREFFVAQELVDVFFWGALRLPPACGYRANGRPGPEPDFFEYRVHCASTLSGALLCGATASWKPLVIERLCHGWNRRKEGRIFSIFFECSDQP